ncbi:MAG: GH92 family glycosyl hydrolase [Mucinivorans sp.]
MKQIFALAACFLLACTPRIVKDYTQFVDPMIGSGGHGHVFVGANVPFGSVQLGPSNITQGWDWCSGYHISDSTLVGYAHTHLSGTGIGDKGDILFMPFTSRKVGPSAADYMSTYKHENETALAGYYSLTDDRYGVRAELTATERVGYHRYTYPAGASDASLLINLHQGTGWDSATDCVARKVDSHTVEGYRFSKGWAADDRVYFAAKFSAPIIDFSYNDTARVAIITFKKGTTVLTADVAISGVSIDGAYRNLAVEGGKGFDVAREEAKEKWNELLSGIQVETTDTAQLKTFYTALYHASIFPSVFSDVDGAYRGADSVEHKGQGFTHYTVFSLWDTYRAAHPLYTLYTPARAADMVKTMISIFDEQGKVPVWHLAGNETDCMTGFSSVQVIGDAILKELPGVDAERGYAAMKAYAELDERGLKEIRELGYYPADSDAESVARAMEYCISDHAIYQVAKKLGYTQDTAYFKKRSEGYKRYFDKSDNFVKGVMRDGTFRTPFDPAHSTHRADDFCEGNAWQYTWLVPHDFQGLFSLFGSVEAAEAKLDSTFNTPYVPAKDASPDISGMIGQVAHGNEPSHATAYAYAAMGRADKTAKIVRHIMDSLYAPTPEGISGNEDCGEMSAWYILNAMGFYQVNPAGGEFVFGSPIFKSVKLKVPGGKTFTIRCENFAPENIYIQSVTLDGKAYDKGSISYRDIMRGAELVFTMGAEAKKAEKTDSK